MKIKLLIDKDKLEILKRNNLEMNKNTTRDFISKAIGKIKIGESTFNCEYKIMCIKDIFYDDIRFQKILGRKAIVNVIRQLTIIKVSGMCLYYEKILKSILNQEKVLINDTYYYSTKPNLKIKDNIIYADFEFIEC